MKDDHGNFNFEGKKATKSNMNEPIFTEKISSSFVIKPYENTIKQVREYFEKNIFNAIECLFQNLKEESGCSSLILINTLLEFIVHVKVADIIDLTGNENTIDKKVSRYLEKIPGFDIEVLHEKPNKQDALLLNRQSSRKNKRSLIQSSSTSTEKMNLRDLYYEIFRNGVMQNYFIKTKNYLISFEMDEIVKSYGGIVALNPYLLYLKLKEDFELLMDNCMDMPAEFDRLKNYLQKYAPNV